MRFTFQELHTREKEESRAICNQRYESHAAHSQDEVGMDRGSLSFSKSMQKTVSQKSTRLFKRFAVIVVKFVSEITIRLVLKVV